MRPFYTRIAFIYGFGRDQVANDVGLTGECRASALAGRLELIA